MLDGVSLVAVFLPWLLIKYVAAPATRGFYCADPSLRLPYHASTVTTPTNVVLSYGAGLAAVLAAHWGRGAWRHTSARAALLGVWEEATVFIFGGLTVQVGGALLLDVSTSLHTLECLCRLARWLLQSAAPRPVSSV